MSETPDVKSARFKRVDYALIAMMILPILACIALKVLCTPEAEGVKISGAMIFLEIPAPVMPRAYPAGFPNRAVLFRQKRPPLMISDRSLVRRLRFIGVSYGSPIFSSVATQARKKDTPLRTVTSLRRLSIRSAAPASP